MARRNPSEDQFWFEQYMQGPYGARQAVPAARRNPKSNVMARAAQLRAAGHSPKEALKAAWAEARGGGKTKKAAGSSRKASGKASRSNPWYSLDHSPLYLPDETQTRSALVRGPYEAYLNPHADEDFSRAEADLPDMWGRSDFWAGNQSQRGGYAMRGGQFSASGTGGFQPVNRRNPRRDSKGRFIKRKSR